MWPFSQALHMILDLKRASPWVNRWGAMLNIPQLLGVAFFYPKTIAQVLGLMCIATLLIAGYIHAQKPFSRLTSLCHVLWLPILPFLIHAWLQAEAAMGYRVWLTYVLVTMMISLYLDARNLYLYWQLDDLAFADFPRSQGTT